MVEVTLEFNSPETLTRELRGVFEVIAMADETDLEDGDYADAMIDTAEQFQLACDHQVLGWFFNGERIHPVAPTSDTDE